MNEPEVASVDALVRDLGDLPRMSDVGAVAVPPSPADAPPADPPSDGVRRDARGEAWDPAVHATTPTGAPRRRSDGTWARRKGAPPPPPTLVAPRGPEAGPAMRSVFVPPADADAGASGDNPGTAETAAPPPVTDYGPTAEAVTRGTWAVARILWGDAWRAEAEEITAWRGAWARWLAHVQAPAIGPTLELLIVGCQAAAARASDLRTRAWWRRAVRWVFPWRRTETTETTETTEKPGA